MSKIEKLDREVMLPGLKMRADFAPNSINKDTRTVDVVWSTGKKGLRSTWDGTSYYEELSMDPSAVRMGRLQSGNTPVLDAHDAFSGCDGVIGVVENARIENGLGLATLRFADTADVADIWRKIESGILKNISVGYTVNRYERQPQADGEEIPTYLAVDWEPKEISIVPVGFDESAVVRGKDSQPGTPCVFVTISDNNDEEVRAMPDLENKDGGQKPNPAPGIDVEKEKSRAATEAKAAEKTRQAEIRKAVSMVKLPEELALRMIEEDKSVDEARIAIIEELARKSKEIETKPAPTATGGKPNQIEERVEGLENAILHKANPGKIQLTEAGRNFRGMSLLEMGRDMLEAGGVSTRGLSKMDLATRSMQVAGDFSNVLANVANKSLRKGYEESPRTFLGWAKQAQLPDFKQVSRTTLGEAPILEVVGEGGEIKRGSMSDGAEKYQLASYAKIVAITRQVIINDDLGAFTTLPEKFGNAAASLESDLVYAILTANAALADSVALFEANTHKNYKASSGAAPSVTTVGAGRAAMRVQKGIDGKRVLNIIPQFIIAPAALELVVAQLIAQITPAQSSNAVPEFMRTMTPVIEPRLDAASATAWYLAAAPGMIDTVEYGYLEGQQGVYSEVRQGFDVDGMEVKARLDFAAKAIDYRGMYKNIGV